MSLHQSDWITIGISVVSSGVLSAGIAGWFNLINGNKQREADRIRAEKDRIAGIEAKTRELALTLALEEWNYHRKVAESGKVAVVSPDSFVFRYHQILSHMENGTLDANAMSVIQRQTVELYHSTQEALAKFRREHGEPAPFDGR
ncbi:hypothetical protein IM316_22040 [Enterobacter cloacae complex sp. S4]|uniref:hypothetical protein n=1 Tax=Enterobacteriaceae TaxID=543 RepID=UPI0010CAE9C2|nr:MULTISPECIES: hypothetical protein [Enterobacteriaceae]MBE4870020.1 hypothetical protein [Enterobacter cloacae complex sp. S4]MDH0515730.1 hypothetical protein [Enterobacter roggenkampii]MDS0028097.1 hypothetical protein [Enterobacter cloacae subsp. cloacae]MDZ3402297.1 hypothetical protein [Klebsiella quasipneumoniae]GCW68603.1 hypothetical protein HmCmsJML088_03809 [Escherichia coli]